MKILKLLNRINYLIILIFLLTSISHAEDKPVDIWNIKEDDKDVNLPSLNKEKDNENLKKKKISVRTLSDAIKKKDRYYKIRRKYNFRRCKVIRLV